MTSAASSTLEQAILRRVLRAGDGRALHLRFRAEVLDKYRDHPSAQLIRTATVGRISIPGSWSLDVGIAEPPAPAEGDAPSEAATQGAPILHATLGDLLDRLPERERDHWIEHLVPQPASVNFLQMRMAAGACIDDGEPRPWTA